MLNAIFKRVNRNKYYKYSRTFTSEFKDKHYYVFALTREVNLENKINFFH